MNLQLVWDKLNLRRTGNTTADTNFQRLVTEWANEALHEIWTGKGMEKTPKWWFLQVTATFNTVASQMTYDLPSTIDGLKVYSLRQKTDDVKLTYLDQRDFDQRFPDPDDQSGGGNPLWYTIYGRDSTTKKPYLRLFPIPASEITMYLRYMTVMDTYDNDTSTDTVILPDKYDSVLLDGILYKWYEFDPERGDSNAKVASFMEGIKKADQDNKTIDDNMIANSHSFSDLRPTLGFVSPAGQ